MSTLKTHNLQSPDSGSVNIAMAPNAGMIVAGLSTYSNQINVGNNIKLGNAGVITATSFVGNIGGTPTFSGDITIPDKIVHTGDTNTVIRFPSDDTISMETAGDERFRIKSDGNIGIGTVNPTSLLTVGARPKTTSAVATVLISPASGNASIQLRGGSPTLEFDGTGGGNGQIFTDSADLAISNGTLDGAGSELVRITTDGKVGIGTDNPKAQLEVYKVGTGVTATSVVRGEQAVFAIMGDATNTGASETDARLVFSSDGDVDPSKILTSPLAAHGFEIALINEEPGSGLRFHNGTANVERLRITSTGRIGINESSPNATLHIKSADGANNRLELVHQNDAANEQNQITFKNNTTQTAYIVSGKDGSNNNIGLSFGTGTSEALRITEDGNHIREKHSRFSTRLAYSTGNESATTKIPMHEPHINVGSDFSNSNDRYTAPVDGDYVFYFFTNVTASSARTYWAEFRKNGAQIFSTLGGIMYDYFPGSGWVNLSGCQMLSLNEGDYVEVWNGTSVVNYDGNNYGQFMGWLIG